MSRCTRRLALALVLACGGCELEPYCLSCRDAGAGSDSGMDAALDDASRGDAAVDAAREDARADGCPVGERCNGVDDDCDGIVDEGFDLRTNPEHCGACDAACAPPHAFGRCDDGECALGDCDVGFHDLDLDPANGCEYRCTPTASDDTTCDLRDDDCDGATDEDVDLIGDPLHCGRCGRVCAVPHAVATCSLGACAIDLCDAGFHDVDALPETGCEYACVPRDPPLEECNLVDDDCDGVVDQGDPGGGVSCGTNVGACLSGVTRCASGRLACEGAVEPATETCNGSDDDCDGEIDEGDPGGGGLCGTDLGACSPGTLRCTSGVLTCVGEVGPEAERCNGRDDDCDGMIDNGDPDGGAPCGTAVGACTLGALACRGGVLVCEGGTRPVIELCNLIDDDCDGSTDDGFDLANDAGNCGECGNRCTFANAIAGCSGGACVLRACEPGFHDADLESSTGCEYACDFRGSEVCNGADDDCDGRVDEGLSPPATFCNPNGVCAGTTPTCTGAGGYVCAYPATYEASEVTCDGLDNDCDGVADEGFALLGALCAQGLGACRTTGTHVCAASGDGVRCTAPPPGAPSDEICDNVDNDCDGAVDERVPDDPTTSWRDGIDLLAIDAVIVDRPAGGVMRIMQYEASRPDATSGEQGVVGGLACSRAGVLPWTNVPWDTARDACCGLNPGGSCPSDAEVGWRLCPAPEWQAACEGPSGGCAWSYSSSCGESQPMVCNGREHDCDPASPGDQDCLYTTGSAAFPGCRTDWGPAGSVHDLSGNAREWTATPRGAGIYELRGGAYTNIEAGRRCAFGFAAADASFSHPNTGFRCCHY